MRPTPLLQAALAAACCIATPASAASSHFDNDAEGWRAAGDSQGPLAWIGSGGNPGGHVQIDDQTIGGVTYFVAPAKFLGNQSAALGSLLRFDLMQVYAGSPNQFDATDVLLSGSGLTLALDFGTHPANGSWTSYAVPLAAGGWHLGTLAGGLASQAQLATVLADLTALHIRAEFRTGSDVGHLDNVVLVPEPATIAMMLAGLGLLGVALRRS